MISSSLILIPPSKIKTYKIKSNEVTKYQKITKQQKRNSEMKLLPLVIGFASAEMILIGITGIKCEDSSTCPSDASRCENSNCQTPCQTDSDCTDGPNQQCHGYFKYCVCDRGYAFNSVKSVCEERCTDDTDCQGDNEICGDERKQKVCACKEGFKNDGNGCKESTDGDEDGGEDGGDESGNQEKKCLPGWGTDVDNCYPQAAVLECSSTGFTLTGLTKSIMYESVLALKSDKTYNINANGENVGILACRETQFQQR